MLRGMISDASWLSEYCIDFGSLIPLYKKLCDMIVIDDDQKEQSSNNDKVDSANGTMVPRMVDQSVMSRLDLSPAGGFLAKRTFRGLEPRLGETLVNKAVEGRTGLAQRYVNELQETGPIDLPETRS